MPGLVEQHLHVNHGDEYRTIKLFASGGLAGAVSRTATAPIDRLKFLLQVQDGNKMMTLAEGWRKMAAEGTIKAYFRGNGANVLKNVPETALKLGCNDKVKGLVAQDGHRLTGTERFLIGGLSGAIAQTFVYPLEVIQTRLAVSVPGTYRGIADAAAKISCQEGNLALLRGIFPCMIGIWPYAGIDIATFELIKEWLGARHGSEIPPQHLLCAGMASSSLGQLVAYPFAFVRTRLQAQGIGGAPLKYNGMFDVLYKTVKYEGVRALYKGVLPDLMKIAPAAGLSWVVFEKTKEWLQVIDGEKTGHTR